MVKRLLIEILDFYKHKLEDDRCTSEDMNTAYRIISESAIGEASIEDLSNHFGQSRSNIKNIITRNFVGKPKRRVFYNFNSFLKFVPKSWCTSRTTEEAEQA